MLRDLGDQPFMESYKLAKYSLQLFQVYQDSTVNESLNMSELE